MIEHDAADFTSEGNARDHAISRLSEGDLRMAQPDVAALTEFIRDAMPLCATLGMRMVAQSPEEVRLELDWDANLCTSSEGLHGGTLMALADSAGGACAFANLPAGASGTSTIESKTNFLGAVHSGTVTATARPLHVGGTTIVIETEIRNGAGKLVAKTTQTQSVLRPKS